MVRQTAWNSRQLLIYCYPRHMAAKAPWLFRHLSPSIALKRKVLAVDLTVSLAYPRKKFCVFKCLYVPETIEWE